jgi:VWFA-related protein
MAVLFTSGEHSTQVVEDRGLLFAAIESLRGWKAVRRPTPVCESLGGSYCSLQDFFANLDFYKTLEDVARMLGAADGRRKAFVLVSEGIPLRLEHEFGTVTSHLDAVESDLAVDTGGFTEITGGYPVPGGGSNFHFNALRRMMASMQRAGVALYALDPRGFVSQQDLGLECFPPPAGRGFDAPPDSCSVAPTWSSPVRYAQDGLALMADATGGFAVTNTDQLDAGVARIIDDLDHYYLLGFYPTDEKGRGFRPVEVTVNRPGVRVRYRRGYTPGDLPSPPKQDDPLEGLSSGVTPVSDLPMRLSAVPVPDAAAGKAASVRVSLEVTAAGLTEVAASDDVSYLILAVRERNGKPAARASGTFRFNPPSSGPASTSMYQVDTALTLDPGRYQLRAAARSTSSRKGGSVYLTLDVPDFAKDELSVTPIALGYAAGPRLPVLRMPTQPVAPAAARTLPFSPTLDREFVPSDVLRLFAQAARPAGLAGVAPRIEVYDVARDLVVKEFVPAIDDRGRVDVTLRLAGLAPGGYVVRLRASDAVTVLVREVGFVVK